MMPTPSNSASRWIASPSKVMRHEPFDGWNSGSVTAMLLQALERVGFGQWRADQQIRPEHPLVIDLPGVDVLGPIRHQGANRRNALAVIVAMGLIEVGQKAMREIVETPRQLQIGVVMRQELVALILAARLGCCQGKFGNCQPYKTSLPKTRRRRTGKAQSLHCRHAGLRASREAPAHPHKVVTHVIGEGVLVAVKREPKAEMTRLALPGPG